MEMVIMLELFYTVFKVSILNTELTNYEMNSMLDSIRYTKQINCRALVSQKLENG